MRLDFRDAPVNQIIKMIAAESNINFIISPEAGEKRTSISLKNVPWDVALKAVLDSNGLGMQELSTGLVRIDFLKKFADDHEQAEKARLATEALVPTKVLVMPLNYLKAAEAVRLIDGMKPKEDPSNVVQQRSVARFRVQAETRSNSIIVEATPNFLSTVKNLLERLDAQTPQVRIQSRIVEFEKNFDEGLGVTWGAPLNIDAGRGLGFGSLPFPNSINSQFSVDPGGATGRGGSLAMKLGSVNNFLALDLKLRAYESKKLAETLQTQDVVVQDNESASMEAGTEDTFITAGGIGSSGTQTNVKYLISLEVMPRVTADGSVQMTLNITGDTRYVLRRKKNRREY
jgi:type IV pilus assembly protein PilQ